MASPQHPAPAGAVDPAFLSHVTVVHDEYESDEEKVGRAGPEEDTLDLSGPAWEGSGAPSSSMLRTVVVTYKAHATCALQATRGLKHYIAKLEELVVQMGVPPAWEEELALASENAGAVLRAFLASRAKCSYTLQELGVGQGADAGDDLASSTHVLAAMHEVADELTREHQRTIGDQERMLAEARTAAERLRQDVAAARAAADEAEGEAGEARREAAVARTQTAAARAAAEQADKAAERAREEASAARADAIAAERKLGSDSAARLVAAKKVEDLAGKLGRMQAEVTEAKAAAEAAAAARAAAEVSLARLTAQAEAGEGSRAALQARLDEVQAKLAAEEAHAAELQDQRQAMASQLSAAQVGATAAEGKAAAAEAAAAVWAEARKPWEGGSTHQPALRRGKDGAVSPLSPGAAPPSPAAGGPAGGEAGSSRAPSGIVAPLAPHTGYSRDASIIADLRMRLADSTRDVHALRSDLDLSQAKSARQLGNLERQVEALAGQASTSCSDKTALVPVEAAPVLEDAAPTGPLHSAFTPSPAEKAPPPSALARVQPSTTSAQRMAFGRAATAPTPPVGYNPASGWKGGIGPAHPYLGHGTPHTPQDTPWHGTWGGHLQEHPTTHPARSQGTSMSAATAWRPTTRTPSGAGSPSSGGRIGAMPGSFYSQASRSMARQGSDGGMDPSVASAIHSASAAIAEVRAKLGPVQAHATHAQHN